MGVTVPYYKYFNWDEYVNYNDGYSALCIDEVEGVIERFPSIANDGSFPVRLTNSGNSFYKVGGFNQKIKMKEGITNCSSMFLYCHDYNQPTLIPSTVTNCNKMFMYCNNFNQPLTIPNKVMDCNYVFQYCYNLNKPVTIGTNVTQLVSAFQSCYKFNQPITIPNNVTSCVSMFFNSAFNQDITFPASVTNLDTTFSNCNSFAKNIYINTVGRSVAPNVVGMLVACNNLLRKNIYCNNLSYINNNYAAYSVVKAAITWTAITNGYYNATYNIYLYKNYTG